ncbi:putative DNA-binding domain-containing protein [Niveispirillum sp. KHB5.9]|uniref:HvfC/BufC family peptide modification chaperone n=1 Tax=Niveispirillum sp. KHB5.9 TaxID=3400269 RepID=UPI003A8C7BCC
MLMELQRSMLAACYGDPAGFVRTLPYLAPVSVAVDKALYVHTATVTAALTGVLVQAYPSLEARLGPEGFAEFACGYLRAHPPRPAVLAGYGEGFGSDLPDELSVLAAADWAAHVAYFAADADPMPIHALAALPPDALAIRCLTPVPSLRLVEGRMGMFSAWLAGRPDVKSVAPPLPTGGDAAMALVWRGPDLLVAATLLPPDAGAFVRALADGATLLEAVNLLADPDFLSPLLALLIGHGLIAAATDDVTR